MLKIINSEFRKIKGLKSLFLAFLIPLVMVSIGLRNVYKGLITTETDIWNSIYNQNAILYSGLLLPLIICIIIALQWRVEYKNGNITNLATLPIDLTKLYIGKVLSTLIIISLNILCFIIILLISSRILAPSESIKLYIITSPLIALICSLPLILIYHFISMTFKNFLFPLGVGLFTTFISFLLQSTSFSIFIPSTYIYKGSFFGVANMENMFNNLIFLLVPVICSLILLLSLNVFRNKSF